MRVYGDFFAIFGCKTVNWDETGGDRPRLFANRNCYKLWRVSGALAQISCSLYVHKINSALKPLSSYLRIETERTETNIYSIHNYFAIKQLPVKARTGRRNWTEVIRFSFWRTDQWESRNALQ